MAAHAATDTAPAPATLVILALLQIHRYIQSHIQHAGTAGWHPAAACHTLLEALS